MIASIRRAALVLTLLALLVPALPAQMVRAATTYYVGESSDDNGTNTTHCSNPNNVDCSLRSAVTIATSGADTIQWTTINRGLTVQTNGTITLAHSVTLQGPGASALQLSGGGVGTVFVVNSGVTATISGLTIEFGRGSITDNASVVGGGIVNRGTLTVSNCTLASNRVVGAAGGAVGIGGGGGFGGAIANLGGILTITSSTFSGNRATGGDGGSVGDGGSGTVGGGGGGGFGGAIYTTGSVTIDTSTFSGNTATGGRGGSGDGSGSGGGGAGLGGALFDNGGSVGITNSTFGGNTATGGNGGGHASGGTTVVNTGTDGGFGVGGTGGVLSGGTGGFGGGGGGTSNDGGMGGFGGGGGGSHSGAPGGYRAGSGGFAAGGGGGGAGIGGAIFSYDVNANLSLITTTIALNTTSGGTGGTGGNAGSGAGDASGIYTTSGLHGDPTTNGAGLQMTLVAKNTASFNPDLDGTFSGIHVLIGDGTGESGIAGGTNGNQVGTGAAPIDPRIASLGNYGGSTQTFALLPGSPAIDAGGVACPTSINNDQRGLARPIGGACDIGAFESRGFTVTLSGGDGQSAATNTPFTQPLQVSMSSGSGEPVQGGVVTFTAPGSGASATFSGNPATIDAQGRASVTATANGVAGAYTVIAAARGASSVNVTLTNVVIAVTPTTLPSFTLQNPYGQTLTASGGTAPYTFAVSAGTLPPGIALDSQTGALSGTPTTTGSYPFTVTATDKNGFTGSQAYTVAITGVSGQTYTVGTTSDATAAASTTDCLSATNTNCRLRDAIQYATSGTDMILFKSGLAGTITLANGTLTLAANVAIQGPGANVLSVDGGCTTCGSGSAPNGGTRVFAVNSGISVTISGLTIQHGYASISSMNGFGGGIYNAGTLALTDCAFVDNRSAQQGGGIYNQAGATATIARSVVSGNGAGYGGGIFNNGTMTVVNSTLTGNATGVGTGGGIATLGSFTLTNSSISGNSAPNGGGGIDVLSGTVTLGNTILAGNAGSSDLYLESIPNSTVTDAGHNLIGTSPHYAFSGAGDRAGIDPALAPLGANGGPTSTVALLPNSPAIDAGDDAICAATGAGAVNGKDQRGTARPAGAHCDIGAYEYVPVRPMIAALSPTTLTAAGGAVTITGSGFQAGTTITLGGSTPISPTTIAADGASLTVTLPAHTAGSPAVVATNPGNLSATSAIPYTPVVASLNPASGVTTGGATVTLTGAGFAVGGTSVAFGTTPATAASVTPTEISVKAPPHAAGAVDITVTVNGQSVTQVGAYTYGAANPLPPQAPPGGTSGGPPNPLPGTRTTGVTSGGATAPKPLPSSR